MKYIKLSLSSLLLLLLFSCEKAEIGTGVEDHFFLENGGAIMPVLVEGNTVSKTFIIVIHGGPGGNAMIYNGLLTDFSDPLEEKYAMVYWDQRSSGNAAGHYSQDEIEMEYFVDDLDKLITVLQHQYGDDIGIFLMGHSWGGALGSAYITTGDNQNRLKGWMDVDGVHNFPDYGKMTRRRLLEVGQDQRNRGNEDNHWDEVIEFCLELDTNNITRKQEFELNAFGHLSEPVLSNNGFVTKFEVDQGDQLVFDLFSNHNTLTALFNNIVTTTKVWDKVSELDYSQALESVEIPGLFLWGRYDMVVPLEMGQEAFAHYGAPEEDKQLIIFESSAHSPMGNEPTAFVREVIQFVDRYK